MPKMTTLGITKEEMIYQFIISLNKGYEGDASDEIVCKAINEYDKLIEKDIIKEIAYVEPGKPTNDPHVLVCKTARGPYPNTLTAQEGQPAGDFNARMYDVATHPAILEDNKEE